MNSFPALSLLTALPAVGAVLILLFGARKKSNPAFARWTALIVSLLALFFVHLLWHHFDSSSAAFQYQERHVWIAPLSVDYRLGIDGIGLLMLLATAIVTPIGIAASWRIPQRVPLYFALVLLLESCMIGSFTALNFFHWFLYWELGLVPAFFLIRLWGGPRRARASTQFLVYTMAGSITLLLCFLAIFLTTHTFDFTDLASLAQSSQLMPVVVEKLAWARFTPHHLALLLFAGAFLGFAVKVPLIPFHTWLPDTYAEAPTGTTILLTGAMSKMGLYGFLLRILVPIFGCAEMQSLLKPLLFLDAVATIVLSAYAALAQRDLKRIFAYSSINHLGLCLLAIFTLLVANPDPAQKYAALSGALLQTLNHALTAAVVFWFIALLESRSAGQRDITDFGGLRKVAPVFAGLMGIALFSSLGLPGLNGFIGEFLIFKGAFPLAPRRQLRHHPWPSAHRNLHPRHNPARLHRATQPPLGRLPRPHPRRAPRPRARHRSHVPLRPLPAAHPRGRQLNRRLLRAKFGFLICS